MGYTLSPHIMMMYWHTQSPCKITATIIFPILLIFSFKPYNMPFEWSNTCNAAFHKLKSKLILALTLAYPQFHSNASQFVLQTDASATALGAVIEQDKVMLLPMLARP